jgi:2-C-methyl-D-erythritol 4-phosphate cytidylyltransferase
MKKSVIIVAGGTGMRMHTEIPKQFLLLGGVPVLMRTVMAFHEFDSGMQFILVLPEEHVAYWETLCKKYSFVLPMQITEGGNTRFESVKNGLQLVAPDSELIAIHDGVRPLVSQATIQTCFDTAAVRGNAVPVMEINDSLRVLEGKSNKPVNRADYRVVQTPQVFRSDQLGESYEHAERTDYADDASVVEAAGHSIHLVPGNPENIKITKPSDILMANTLLAQL